MLCSPDLPLWVVADGMGGHQAGEVASALVVEMLAGHSTARDLAQRTDALRQAAIEANRRLVNMAGDQTIGSTVVMLTADDLEFSCLWAGDSRAYRARGDSLRQLTRDHSLVQELVDAGELDPAMAASHPNANVIRRAVGASPQLDLDMVRGDLADGDTFLLASDGLTRLVDDAEIKLRLGQDDIEAAADNFLDAALSRGAPDNVSLVIVRRVP